MHSQSIACEDIGIMDLQTFQFILSGVISGIIVFITVPILIHVAYVKDLYDKPDNERKLHDRYVPTFGGVSLFLAIVVGFSLSGIAHAFNGYSYLIAALTILFFTGLKDDIIGLSPVKKLGIQVLSALLLIFGCGIYIDNFYGVFGINELPFAVSVLLTLFTTIVITNAYNLIDGVDGLAGGIGAIASLFFGIGFWIAGELAMAVFCGILAVSLVAFLRFNFKPASIFMGDTGSLIVGFMLSVFAIKFVGLNNAAAYTKVFGNSSPILPVAILAVPLYDTLSVFYKRIRRGISPFQPGRDHIHHTVLEMGFSHKGVSLILYASGTIIACSIMILSPLNVNILLALTLLSVGLFLPAGGIKRAFLKKMGFNIESRLMTSILINRLRTLDPPASESKELITKNNPRSATNLIESE